MAERISVNAQQRKTRRLELRVIAIARIMAERIFKGHLGYGSWTPQEREFVNAVDALDLEVRK